MKRWGRNRIGYVHFGYSDFYDFDNFVIKLLEVLKQNETYSLLLKINYNKTSYCMGGKQSGFKHESNTEEFVSLHRVFIKLIKNSLDNYDVYEINSIEVLYVLVQDLPELKLKNINKVNFNKEFVSIKDGKDIKNRFKFIPLTVDTKYLGKLIIADRLFYLSKINKQRDLLNENILSVNDEDSMYLYNNDTIIINRKDKNIYFRDIFDISGMFINKVEDNIVNENTFVRKIGNISITITDNNIVKVETLKSLSPIRFIPKLLKDEANPFIGSWDVEAFEDFDGYAKVYALGFTVLNEAVKMYYLGKNMTSEQLVLSCLNDMLINKYNGYTFYTHNFGRYDCHFLIKILKEENVRLGREYYKIKELSRDSKILKLEIKVNKSLSDRKQSKIGSRKNPGYNSITIIDSLNILNQSLDKLCHSFDVPVTKGKFPYSFVKRDTLNYIGNTPGYEYWEKISLEDYNKLLKSDWNLKEECLKYLEKDLTSLVLIMNKFNEYINRKYHLQVTDSLTISRLALNIFLKDYLKNSKLPVISRNMFNDIKQAYYGGVTEVYKPYGQNLLHYDVNSLYPFAALNPMAGVDCKYIEILGKTIDLTDLFGFFYCEIETDSNYLGLLPVHDEQGLIMPNGCWKGWYFSEELKYASEKGYRIKVIKGYNFNKVYNVFTDYIKNLYDVKSTTKDMVEKDIAKRLLNHLLGRFGLNIVKPVTRCVNLDELSLIFSTREVKGKPIKITDNDYWVTYNPNVDQEICEDHGIDFIKVQNLTPKTDIEKINEFRDVSLSTAAAVTAYARIYMSKIKQNILDKGGNIYYTDTDSIVTDIHLDENLIGNELGKFKLEYKIKQGYYISNKTYYIDLSEPIFDHYTNKEVYSVIKSKSVKSDSLSLDSFKELYDGVNVEAIKRSSVKDHYMGSVKIIDKTVELNYDSYTKRQKIYKEGKWVDTKPLVLGKQVDNKVTGLDKDNKVTGLDKDNKVTGLDKDNKVMGLDKFSIFNYKKYILMNNLTIDFWTNKMLNLICIFTLIIFSVIIFIITKEDIFDYNQNISCTDLDVLDVLDILEQRYHDDYMEEPIDIYIYEDLSFFKRFINLFTEKNYKPYNICTDSIKSSSRFIYPEIIKLDSTLNSDRPQVLTSLLKYKLEIAYTEIEKLNDQLSILEIKSLRKENMVWDALSVCKKALRGSPMIGYDSPLLGSNSPLLGRGSSFAGWSSPYIG